MASPAFGTAGTQFQATTTAMNVDVPDSVAADDIIVVTAFVDCSSSDATISALPSGFAQAPDSPVNVDIGNPTDSRLYVMWKRATGADSTAGTYDFTVSASVYVNGQAIRYTGAITSGDPWDVTDSDFTTSGVNDTPAVQDTTTVADTLLVWAATNWNGGAWTPPSGFTERRDTGDQVCTVADKAQTSAGDTGSIVGTCAGSAKSGAWLGALKSAAAAAPESSTYAPVRLAGRIGPDRRVFLPNRFDDVSAAVPLDVTADVATLILSGVDPTLAGSGAASVTADVAILVLSGIDATFGGTGIASIPADTATLIFSGIDSTIAGSGATSITADVATLTFSGVDVSASSGATNVTADVAVLILTGVTPTIAGSGATSTTADVAVLTFSGVDVTATSGTAVAADTAVLTLSGVTPTIAGTGAGGTTADAATLALTGITPALAGSGFITATVDTAVLVFVGVEVGGFVGQQVTPDDRIHLIPAVSRTYEITALSRVLDVMADPRTLTVPVD